MSLEINQSNILPLLVSTITIIIIILLMLMAIKLMGSYRNKSSYVQFISALLLALLQQSLQISSALSQQNSHQLLIISTTIGLISFIILNFVMMRLSISMGKVRFLPTLVFLLLAIGAFISSYVMEPYIINNGVQIYNTYPILDFLYLIITIVYLTQSRSSFLPGYFNIGILMVLISQLANIFYTYIFEQSQAWLNVLKLGAPILYYVFIFLLLFDLVMSKLITTYQSSIQDGLTGLYLRSVFHKKMISLAARKPIAIIFCDIDNFKLLNDTKGHQAADVALQQVAQIIKTEVQPYGYAGRYGGEELLGGIAIDHVKAITVAEKIRARVEQETPVTVSVGVSTIKDSNDIQRMISMADEAMYYSKTTGKNKVTAYRSLPASLKK